MSNNIFQDEIIRPELQAGIKKLGFIEPTRVQTGVIPKLLHKKNLVVQAATGSGKTHAFMIPVLNTVDTADKTTQAIITAPSRELAQQLFNNAKELRDKSELDISIMHLAGGIDRERQMAKVEHNKPQLVIGTPGRIKDFIEKKLIKAEDVRTMIIDEADMTLDLGFLNDVDEIASRLSQDTDISVFSATIPARLKPFLNKYLQKPEYVVIDNPTVISPTVHNYLIDIGGRSRNGVIYDLLNIGQPYMVLIFANTKSDVDDIHHYLSKKGLEVAKIHGDISVRERKRVMRDVQDLKYQYIVATDLAARGIDIEGISLVINAALPKDLEFFIHRVGRTGRNNMEGTAISLVTADEMEPVHQLEHLGIKFEIKAIKNGELVDRADFGRRKKREATNEKLDPRLVGLVKKTKLKKKPGYKKRIKTAIARDQQQKRKISQRQAARDERRARKAKED